MNPDLSATLNNRLAYVVVREDLTSPLVRSQVIDVLTHVAEQGSGRILLTWFYRVDYVFRNKRTIRAIRKELQDAGIGLVAIPFLAFSFPVRWFLLPLVLPQWVLGLAWIYTLKGCRVFHCRSYNAGLAAAILKIFARAKLVFDPRSPYPEEKVAAGIWPADSLDYRCWKRIEGYICARSDAVIAISQPFAQSLEAARARGRVHMIPNNFPESFLRYREPATSDVCEPAVVTIGYVGSFGHWNKPEPYLAFLGAVMRSCGFPVRGLFVTSRESRVYLDDAISRSDLDAGSISVVSVDQEDVLEQLWRMDVGLQIMSHADDRLSVKFVEYLAAGVPVIVSENVRGAAYVTEKEGVGFVLDSNLSNSTEAVEFVRDVVRDRETWRAKCRALAEDRYSPRIVAAQLAHLYSLPGKAG